MKNVRYKTLYLDFINDSKLLSDEVKKHLKNKLNKEVSEYISVRKLIAINKIISKEIYTFLDYKRIASLKSYDQKFVKHVLTYQEQYGLSNSQVALEFKLSRNTISNWKKRKVEQ